MFLWNRNLIEETKVGEIVVCNVRGKGIPIVHGVVRKFGLGRVCGLEAGFPIPPTITNISNVLLLTLSI